MWIADAPAEMFETLREVSGAWFSYEVSLSDLELLVPLMIKFFSIS